MSVLKWWRNAVSFTKNVCVKRLMTGNPVLCEAPVDSKKKTLSRREEHPLSVCLRYMKSNAYQKTYGNKPVWHVYVRNFKGHITPETRSSCTWPNGFFRKNNPCPICRDVYLKPHYTNIDLLKQFISPHGGYIISTRKTGVCQKQHQNIVVAIKKAQNYGYLTFHVPHRHYNYSLYNKK